MNSTLKSLFDIYINQDYYEKEIIKDTDYIQLSLELEKIENILEQNYSIEFINNITQHYMDLCNIYRKYDFINGLLLGIILGNRLNKTHNNEFLNMCYNQVKDSI